MENQKLTIADVCLYHNAKVEYKGEIYEMYCINLYKQGMILIDIIDYGHKYIPIAECKLVLRSIEDMTEKECIFIYETIIGESIGDTRYIVEKNKTEINIETIYNIDYDDKTNVFIPYSLEIYYTQEGKVNNVDGERMKIIIDYLRSICIDVDNFIAEGKAIYDNKMN